MSTHGNGCVVLHLLGQQIKAEVKMKNRKYALFTHPIYIYGIPTLCKALSEVRQIVKIIKTKLVLKVLTGNYQNKSG